MVLILNDAVALGGFRMNGSSRQSKVGERSSSRRGPLSLMRLINGWLLPWSTNMLMSPLPAVQLETHNESHLHVLISRSTFYSEDPSKSIKLSMESALKRLPVSFARWHATRASCTGCTRRRLGRLACGTTTGRRASRLGASSTSFFMQLNVCHFCI